MDAKHTGKIYGINGPVIYLKGDCGFKISEMVYVGPEKLVGEVIGLKKGMTTVQVFEETTGLKPGETKTKTITTPVGHIISKDIVGYPKKISKVGFIFNSTVLSY